VWPCRGLFLGNASVRSLLPISLIAWLALSFSADVSAAQTPGALRQRHPWGRFEPGAWKLVRVVTETFDDQGTVASTSTTETRTTLNQIDPDGVTLLVEVVVEIGGRRLIAEPQRIKQGFYGELAGQQVTLSDGGPATVTIDGRGYPCRIEQTECSTASARIVTKTCYSATVAPYALKLDSVTTDLRTGEWLSETQWQVTSLDTPCGLLRQNGNVAHVTSVHKHARGTTTTVTATSTEVPGGVICHNAKEVDASGRLVRRSTLDLVAYGAEPEGARAGLRRNRAWYRHRVNHLTPQ
jgi:hypothetical protein